MGPESRAHARGSLCRDGLHAKRGLRPLCPCRRRRGARSRAVASCLSGLQRPDGSWVSGDQRPPISARGPIVYTALGMRAVQTDLPAGRRSECAGCDYVASIERPRHHASLRQLLGGGRRRFHGAHLAACTSVSIRRPAGRLAARWPTSYSTTSWHAARDDGWPRHAEAAIGQYRPIAANRLGATLLERGPSPAPLGPAVQSSSTSTGTW